jgi:hypothetical protein
MALFKNKKTNKLHDLNASYGGYPGVDAHEGHRLNPNLSSSAQMNNDKRITGVNQPHTAADYKAKQDTLARVQSAKVPGVKKPGA